MLASMPNCCDQFQEFSPQIVYLASTGSTANIKQTKSQCQTQNPQPISRWPSPSPYLSSAGAFNEFADDQQPFDCYSSQSLFSSSSAVLPMHSGQTTNCYPYRLDNNQEIPRTVTSAHNRESSLSSLGSAGPASPYTTNISHPQIVGDIFDFNDIPSFSTPKTLTPAQTPPHETLLIPQFSSNFQNSSNVPIDVMPIPEISYQDRPSMASSLSHGTPEISTISDQEKNQQQNRENSSPNLWMTEDILSCEQSYKNLARLDRTMTEVYEDDLFNSNVQISSTPSPSISNTTITHSPNNQIFEQRLQAANNQHLRASSQGPLILPTRDCTPFRHVSPLAQTSNFEMNSPSLRIGTVLHLREQQKVENDARIFQEQLCKESTMQSTPNTVSPKDVDLVYHEDGEESLVSLFPNQQKSASIIPTYQLKQEPIESDENPSKQNYGGITTTQRASSSTYSSSQQVPNQNNFDFSMPIIDDNIQCTSQKYSFLRPQAHRHSSTISNPVVNFSAIHTSVELKKNEYKPESRTLEIKKPARVSADTGTYTCTYHGCTLRFDTPARLQRHKREGHRSSSAAAVAAATASTISGVGYNGMTSTAHRNSQAGPHRCDRINPSTGKPCNTVFSRPYDLTRHEDTIHNTQKQKVYCPLCEEEKSFSRNDALTRHMRVVHPEYVDTSSRRRRGPSS